MSGTETKVRKPRAKKEKGVKPEAKQKVKIEVPQVPVASKLVVKGEPTSRSKGVTSLFWSIEGHHGLYGFAQNLKPTGVADALKDIGRAHDRVVAGFVSNPEQNVTNYAIFERQDAIQDALLKAMGK